MRVIREVDARRRVGGASAGIDAERTDFPVRRNSPNDEEDQDEPGGEQEETKPAPPATVPFVVRARREAGWRSDDDGLHKREAGWCCGYDRPPKHEAGWRGGDDGLRRRKAGWRFGDDRLRGRRRGNGDDILRGRLRFRWFWLDRRGRVGGGAGAGQPVKPRLQLRLIGSEILWVYGTPWEEAHVRPR